MQPDTERRVEGIIDRQTGQLLSEQAAVELFQRLKIERVELSNRLRDVEHQIIMAMEAKAATKLRSAGDTNWTAATIITTTDRKWDLTKFGELLNVVGPDRFFAVVKVEPRWRETNELAKEGGTVREIIESSLTEESAKKLKVI